MSIAQQIRSSINERDARVITAALFDAIMDAAEALYPPPGPTRLARFADLPDSTQYAVISGCRTLPPALVEVALKASVA